MSIIYAKHDIVTHKMETVLRTSKDLLVMQPKSQIFKNAFDYLIFSYFKLEKNSAFL